MPHNPVPFDFVPFSNNEPILKTVDDWEHVGDALYTGFIEYELTALTDIHIVGRQETQQSRDGITISKSHFNKNSSGFFIPASSIKGMIRTFIEALTNSWVSQETTEFPKINGGRYIGFAPYSNGIPGTEIAVGPAIPRHLHPVKCGKLDLSSFLFGIVFEGTDGEAYPSRIKFEDIKVDDTALCDVTNLPDVPGKAFMGGPKPCASSWWYFMPEGYGYRNAGRHKPAVFTGSTFRGRKFYYHQNPENALKWYRESDIWPRTGPRQGNNVSLYYEYPVQTIQKAKVLSPCRIYFERLPEPLLNLLILTLQPGQYIKHKIGYGKAFGLGSIDLKISKIICYGDNLSLSLEDKAYPFNEVVKNGFNNLDTIKHLEYINKKSLNWLTKILSVQNMDKLLFTYPPFGNQYFKTPVTHQAFSSASSIEDITKFHYTQKKTVNFRYYQSQSVGYKTIIKTRSP